MFDSNLFIDTREPPAEETRIQYWGTLSSYKADLARQSNVQRQRAEDYHRGWPMLVATRREAITTRLKANLKSVWTARITSDHVRVRALFKDIGALVAKSGDSEEIVALINNLPVRYRAKVFTAIEDHHRLYYFHCNHCDEYHHYDEERRTNNDDSICEECADADFCYSECMDCYIYTDNAYSVWYSVRAFNNGDADDWCTTRYGNRNFHSWENGFFSDEDDYYDVCGDGDGDVYSDGIPNWHNAHKDFVIKNASGKYPALGMELEIYVEDRREFAESTTCEFGRNVIMEKDGSLDDDHGIELISHPLGREEWDVFGPSLFKHVQTHDGVGYNDPAGSNYGIHLTVGREHFSPLAEARIAMFLVDDKNADFVRAVAQRAQIYCHQNGIGFAGAHGAKVSSITMDTCSVFNGIKNKYEKKIYGRGKYCPINFKDRLAEFRIFQSTTNITSFQKNLEFIWALWKWTLPQTASGCSHCHKDFLMWLNKRQQRKEFPRLAEFLSKRVFYSTNSPPIISSWQNLMTKPTEDEAAEQMAA